MNNELDLIKFSHLISEAEVMECLIFVSSLYAFMKACIIYREPALFNLGDDPNHP